MKTRKSLVSSSLIYLLAFFSILIFTGCTSTNSVVQEELLIQKKPRFEGEELFKPNNLLEKGDQGVDFIIVDKEEQFIAELDFDNEFSLRKISDNTLVSVPASDAEIGKDQTLTRYISSNEAGELTIQLHKTECEPSFLRKMKYSVAVDYKDQVTGSITTFFGCGDYVPDYKLHNLWKVVEFEGGPLDKKDFVQNFPVFEFNVNTGIVLGTDGCNQVSSSIEIEYNKLGFGPFFGTRMACARMDMGEKITTTMSGTQFDYAFKENRLELSQDGRVILVLHNVD